MSGEARRFVFEKLGDSYGDCENAAFAYNYLLRFNDSDKPDAKSVLRKSAKVIAQKSLKGDLYKAAFNNHKKILEHTGTSREVETRGKMVTGLGGMHPTEASVVFNPLYGVPMITGSSLKGLAAHYCSECWGEKDAAYKLGKDFDSTGKIYNILFGTTEEAGFIRFDDAWILPGENSGFFEDVMTPHHQAYYTEKGKNAPADTDTPIPVGFLSVRGRFLLHVCCEEKERKRAEAWEKLVLKLLEEALTAWGIGGKTSSGYGLMRVL